MAPNASTNTVEPSRPLKTPAKSYRVYAGSLHNTAKITTDTLSNAAVSSPAKRKYAIPRDVVWDIKTFKGKTNKVAMRAFLQAEGAKPEEYTPDKSCAQLVVSIQRIQQKIVDDQNAAKQAKAKGLSIPAKKSPIVTLKMGNATGLRNGESSNTPSRRAGKGDGGDKSAAKSIPMIDVALNKTIDQRKITGRSNGGSSTTPMKRAREEGDDKDNAKPSQKPKTSGEMEPTVPSGISINLKESGGKDDGSDSDSDHEQGGDDNNEDSEDDGDDSDSSSSDSSSNPFAWYYDSDEEDDTPPAPFDPDWREEPTVQFPNAYEDPEVPEHLKVAARALRMIKGVAMDDIYAHTANHKVRVKTTDGNFKIRGDDLEDPTEWARFMGATRISYVKEKVNGKPKIIMGMEAQDLIHTIVDSAHQIKYREGKFGTKHARSQDAKLKIAYKNDKAARKSLEKHVALLIDTVNCFRDARLLIKEIFGPGVDELSEETGSIFNWPEQDKDTENGDDEAEERTPEKLSFVPAFTIWHRDPDGKYADVRKMPLFQAVDESMESTAVGDKPMEQQTTASGHAPTGSQVTAVVEQISEVETIAVVDELAEVPANTVGNSEPSTQKHATEVESGVSEGYRGDDEMEH